MHYQRLVVKLGTSTLTGGSQKISPSKVFDIVRQVIALREEGSQVILVSSGAMAAGREALNFPDLPKFMPAKQMLAAVGQPRLMGLYDQFFRMYGETAAQVLLTRIDMSDRRSYLNAHDTLEALLGQGIIPIINENDTVATDEIRIGENDSLSAQVANMLEADCLVLLTDQPGFYTSDPRRDASAQLIPIIDSAEIPEAMWKAANGTSTGLGTGGMSTKLEAADLARHSGTTTVIAFGGEADVLLRIAHQEPVGTTIMPLVNKLEGRKRYLLAGMRATGAISIDAGAVKALEEGGSLLPVGVKKVKGNFERGDTVRIMDPTGKVIALGLANYAAKDLARCAGRHSAEIEPTLGYTFGDEVIHRNNLFLL